MNMKNIKEQAIEENETLQKWGSLTLDEQLAEMAKQEPTREQFMENNWLISGGK